MTQWEADFCVGETMGALALAVNRMGLDGWQLATVVEGHDPIKGTAYVVAWVKRPKPHKRSQALTAVA